MINVILANNTRPPISGPFLIRYSACGVFLSLLKNGLDARYIDQITEAGKGSIPVYEQTSGDICCYGVYFGNKVNAFRLMEEARRSENPPHKIIAFGSFASAFSEEVLSRGLADIVVGDDPEFVMPVVIRKVDDVDQLSDIPNLIYRHKGKTVHTRKHSFPDLDEIPLVGPYLYSQGLRPAHIITARGCQYHCIYCDRNAHWGGGVRNRSVENVLSEVRELVLNQHVNEIYFLDEDLPADRERLTKLCAGMRQIKKNFRWSCCACVDSVSKELLLLMKYSGCSVVNFGVESASTDVLRRIGKRYSRKDILNTLRWTEEAGIKVEIMLTIGNPGETDADRDLTLSLLQEIGSDITVTTNQMVIAPGTALYRKGLREGWFTEKSYFEDEQVFYYPASEEV
jgi:anaerobic magnesium-protoporphyrin IX monomethyl ester cyclase